MVLVVPARREALGVMNSRLRREWIGELV